MAGHNSSQGNLDVYHPVVVTPDVINPNLKHWAAPAVSAQESVTENDLFELLQMSLDEIQEHKEQRLQGIERERVLAQVISRICQSLDLNTIFTAAMTEVRELLYVDRVAIFQFDQDSNYVEGQFVAEDVAPEYESALAQKVRDRCFGEEYRTQYEVGHILSIPDTYEAGLSDCHLQILTRFKIRANLVVPLLQQQKLWGLICVHQCCGPRLWQPAEVEFISRIALQLGVALQQAELMEQARLDSAKIEAQKQQLERVAKQERTLTQIIECIRQTLDMQQIFATATAVVRQLLQADRVAIYRFHGTDHQPVKGEFVAEDMASENYSSVLAVNLHDQHFGDSYATAHRQNQIVAIADTYDEAVSNDHFQTLAKLQVRADLVIPLLQGHSSWGLLCVHQCDKPRQWKQSEIDFTTRIGSQLSVALQQAELFAQTQSHSWELQQALEEVEHQKEQLEQVAAQERASAYVMRRIRQSLEVEHIFKVTTQEVQQILKCDRVIVYQFSPNWGGEVVFETVNSNHSNPLLDQPRPLLKWDDSYLQEQEGSEYQYLKPTITPDIYQANYSFCHMQKLEEWQIRASLIVPILIGETLWGLLAAYQNKAPRNWKPWEVQLLERVGDQLGIALHQTQLLQQLQTAKEAADTANQSKSRFLASMSHELRTPLNAILGFSQLMGRDRNMTPEQHQTLEIINQSGAHLLNLINDVLEMSKIEAGKTTLNQSDFNLRSLLDSLHNMLKLKADAKGLTLSFNCDPNVPGVIQTDESKLRQVLINLVGNAIKFTQKGKVSLQVDLQTQGLPTGDRNPNLCTLSFTVEDTGPGLSATDLETIFDAFTQTDVGRKSVEGTGLGLPISRHFARLMGGDISVTSQLGHGTTVQFLIQVQASSMAESPVKLRQRIVALDPSQPPYRILVAEDRLESRKLMVQLLQSVGFEVQAVSNGEEAISQWLTWQPHLIWMDWQMPIMNGFEATQRIRKVESLRARAESGTKSEIEPSVQLAISPSTAFTPLDQTVILALTASVFEDTRRETSQAGCNDFINKPFQEDEIFEKMATYLGVKYLYEDIIPIHSSSSGPLQRNELEQLLSEQSSAWLSNTLQAAIELDEQAISLLIEEIQEQEPRVAKDLNELVKNLKLDCLADLLQQALARQQPHP